LCPGGTAQQEGMRAVLVTSVWMWSAKVGYAKSEGLLGSSTRDLGLEWARGLTSESQVL
jgi:hypothetical protein